MAESLGEFDRISKFFKTLSRNPEVSLELKDDAAEWIPPAGRRVVFSTDTMVEGRHFLPDTDAFSLGWKIAAVNLSDLAACGAEPAGLLLSLGVPETVMGAWLEGFVAGLEASQAAFQWDLWGGDSVSTATDIVLGATVIGTVPPCGMLKRSGARQGDLVAVSGTLGDGAVGLRLKRERLNGGAEAYLIARYDRPTPRVALGAALRDIASAGMDISDGVFGDAGHLARASGITVQIEADAIPISDALRQHLKAVPADQNIALAGGDDYELLLTIPPAGLAKAQAEAARLGESLTVIGVCKDDGGDVPVVALIGGEEIPAPPGWTHY